MRKELRQLLLIPLLVFLLPVGGMLLVLHRPEELKPGAALAIDEAVQHLRDEALMGPGKDWEALRRAAHASLERAPSMAGLDQALAALVQALGDPHTSYWPPDLARRATQGLPARPNDANPAPSLVHEGWPMLQVGAMMHIDSPRSRAAALALRKSTLAAMAASPCGLILDLRDNQGGNMYPMLMGLAPLFGRRPHEAMMSFQTRKGPGPAVTMQTISANLGDDWPADAGLKYALYEGRVAVLIGPRTASSGEMVVIASLGQRGWRSFGQATAGYTTGNVPVPLSNGGLLALTTARVLTSTGMVVQGPLTPDSPTEGDALPAASRWLESGCRRP